MKKIALRGKRGFGKFALVDDEDYEWLNKWNWSVTSYGYASTWHNKAVLTMHRLLTGNHPGKLVDHIDCKKLNNTKANLRLVNHQQNQTNRKPRGKSFYKGIYWNKEAKRWTAQIESNGKHWFIGHFKEERHAAMAYDIWAKETHHQYAYLNFKEQERVANDP